MEAADEEGSGSGGERMIKCKVGFVSLLIAFCLVGCGTKDEPVVQEKEAWDSVDVQISNLPENASVYAIASNGIYYGISKNTDYSGNEPTSENEFHFLDHSGNDCMILQKGDMNTFSVESDGNNAILCNATDEGMEIIKLLPEGNETLFQQNAPQFPIIQTCEQYMVSIRNNFTDDYTMYENTLVLRDTEKNEEKVIYRTLWDNEKAIGEDLGCVSINNEAVCFTLNKSYENRESEHILFLYDINKEEIVEEIPLRTRAYYAAYGGEEAGLLLSETDDSTYMEEAGSMGYIEDGAYVETAKIPLISASNMIRNGSYTGDGYYFTTYDAAYFWDTKANRIYVYDYQWIENNRSKVVLSEDGLKYVVIDGNSTYIRTISVK